MDRRRVFARVYRAFTRVVSYGCEVYMGVERNYSINKVYRNQP